MIEDFKEANGKMREKLEKNRLFRKALAFSRLFSLLAFSRGKKHVE